MPRHESEIELLVGFELAGDLIEVRQGFGRRLDRDQRRKQFLLQRLFGQLLWQKPEFLIKEDSSPVIQCRFV